MMKFLQAISEPSQQTNNLILRPLSGENQWGMMIYNFVYIFTVYHTIYSSTNKFGVYLFPTFNSDYNVQCHDLWYRYLDTHHLPLLHPLPPHQRNRSQVERYEYQLRYGKFEPSDSWPHCQGRGESTPQGHRGGQ